MSIVIRDDLTVAIPEDLAHELGLHRGSSVEWERTDDGALKLRPSVPRGEAILAIRGAGRKYLEQGESGVESFLKWRQDERELDDTYHQ